MKGFVQFLGSYPQQPDPLHKINLFLILHLQYIFSDIDSVIDK